MGTANSSGPSRRLTKWVPRPVRKIARRFILNSADRRRAQDIFRLAVRPTDIFLVGHPKSGNTWLAYMLAVATQGGDKDEHVTMANLAQFVPTVHGNDAKVGEHAHLPDPRMFRNEWPDFPDLYPRTVYLVRDPRSVLVSYFHHYRVTTQDEELSLDSFIELYLKHGCIRHWEPRLVRWDRQVADWRRRAQSGSVLVVRYEDLYRDRQTVLRDVLNFCGIAAPTDAISTSIARGGFEEMRSSEERHGAEAYPQEPGERGWFVRRGRPDSWKDELPSISREAIERELHVSMEEMGYHE